MGVVLRVRVRVRVRQRRTLTAVVTSPIHRAMKAHSNLGVSLYKLWELQSAVPTDFLTRFEANKFSFWFSQLAVDEVTALDGSRLLCIKE